MTGEHLDALQPETEPTEQYGASVTMTTNNQIIVASGRGMVAAAMGGNTIRYGADGKRIENDDVVQHPTFGVAAFADNIVVSDCPLDQEQQ